MERVLASVSIVCLSAFSIIILSLHFLPTGYDPVSQAVSDYAVGKFGELAAAGFLVGGTGLTALGVGLFVTSTGSRAFRAGAVFLAVAGVAMFAVGGFPTDLEGGAPTFPGTIHSILSEVVFSLGPIGALLVIYSRSRKLFAVALPAYLLAGAPLSASLAYSPGYTGLAERIFIAFLLALWASIAVWLFRGSQNRR